MVLIRFITEKVTNFSVDLEQMFFSIYKFEKITRFFPFENDIFPQFPSKVNVATLPQIPPALLRNVRVSSSRQALRSEGIPWKRSRTIPTRNVDDKVAKKFSILSQASTIHGVYI